MRHKDFLELFTKVARKRIPARRLAAMWRGQETSIDWEGAEEALFKSKVNPII
jgi:hypothetical protein